MVWTKRIPVLGFVFGAATIASIASFAYIASRLLSSRNEHTLEKALAGTSLVLTIRYQRGFMMIHIGEIQRTTAKLFFSCWFLVANVAFNSTPKDEIRSEFIHLFGLCDLVGSLALSMALATKLRGLSSPKQSISNKPKVASDSKMTRSLEQVNRAAILLVMGCSVYRFVLLEYTLLLKGWTVIFLNNSEIGDPVRGNQQIVEVFLSVISGGILSDMLCMLVKVLLDLLYLARSLKHDHPSDNWEYTVIERTSLILHSTGDFMLFGVLAAGFIIKFVSEDPTYLKTFFILLPSMLIHSFVIIYVRSSDDVTTEERK